MTFLGKINDIRDKGCSADGDSWFEQYNGGFYPHINPLKEYFFQGRLALMTN